MASQPLETIPEDRKPAKPAKSPGRVAAGKRLAERNRLAREAAKKRAEAEAEAAILAAATTTASNTEAASGSSGLSLVTVLGIGGLIVFILGVYYKRLAAICQAT